MKTFALSLVLAAFGGLVLLTLPQGVLAYGGGSVGIFPVIAPPQVNQSSVPITAPVPVGQVLGVKSFRFLTNLRSGMSANDIKELQKRLRAEGFFTFRADTGYFGPITFAAVKAYQRAHPAIGYITGFVGPLTRTELNSTAAPVVGAEKPASLASKVLGGIQSALAWSAAQ